MNPWSAAADAVLILHVAFVLFVVAGLLLIFVGAAAGWRWVRSRALRLAHLAAIGIVVAQSWLGATCPLTTLEMALRVRAGDATYAGSFVAHWLHAALYWRAPAWAFVVAYTAFGTAVLASWFVVRPERIGDVAARPPRAARRDPATPRSTRKRSAAE